MNQPAQPLQEPTTHQKMAASVHAVFAAGQGIQISSAQAEQVVEMKLWLAAIANGQLQIVDMNAPQTPAPPPLTPDPAADGADPN